MWQAYANIHFFKMSLAALFPALGRRAFCCLHRFKADAFCLCFLCLLAFLASLPLLPRHAIAANTLNGLHFEPGDTSLLVLDDEGVLSSTGNAALFQQAEYSFFVLPPCAGVRRLSCLFKEAQAIKEAKPEDAILLLTTTAHSRLISALYLSEKASQLIDGVVHFRSRAEMSAPPAIRPLNGPPFLMIVGEDDPAGQIAAGRAFTDHLRASGVWSWFVMLPHQRPRGQKYPPVISLIDYFIGASRVPPKMRQALQGAALWQAPPFNLEGFYNKTRFLRDVPVDDHFRREFMNYLQLSPYTAKQWPLKTYRVFDVLAYQASQPDLAGKRYLVSRNKFGQFLSLDLEKYRPYQPVIVVGLDHERNLFRINWFFRNKAKYSWQPQISAPPISVNPLGGFVYFQKPLPEALTIPFSIRSKLTFESLTFQEDDPLAVLGSYSPLLRATITGRNNCINCHALDGVGGEGHHIEAATGRYQGGYALPLRAYSQVVLKEFLYDQEKVAAEIGVTPNRVTARQAKALWALLTKNPVRD